MDSEEAFMDDVRDNASRVHLVKYFTTDVDQYHSDNETVVKKINDEVQ